MMTEPSNITGYSQLFDDKFMTGGQKQKPTQPAPAQYSPKKGVLAETGG
jgi:hypothetical protein